MEPRLKVDLPRLGYKLTTWQHAAFIPPRTHQSFRTHGISKRLPFRFISVAVRFSRFVSSSSSTPIVHHISTQCRKNRISNVRRMTVKVNQGRRKWRHSIAVDHILLVISTFTVSEALPLCQRTVYVTDRQPEKSFNLAATVIIVGHVWFPVRF